MFVMLFIKKIQNQVAIFTKDGGRECPTDHFWLKISKNPSNPFLKKEIEKQYVFWKNTKTVIRGHFFENIPQKYPAMIFFVPFCLNF